MRLGSQNFGFLGLKNVLHAVFSALFSEILFSQFLKAKYGTCRKMGQLGLVMQKIGVKGGGHA